MSDTAIVASFQRLLRKFSHCFAAPSFASFLTLMSGSLLDLSRHTITGMVRAAAAVALRDITSFHHFFSRAPWVPDALGLVLGLIIEHLLPVNGPLDVVLVRWEDPRSRASASCQRSGDLLARTLLGNGSRSACMAKRCGCDCW